MRTKGHVYIVRSLRIVGHVRTKILKAVARVASTTHEAESSDRDGAAANRGDRDPLGVQTLQQLFEFRFDRRTLPSVAAGKDERSHIGWVDLGHGCGWQQRDAAHGADRSGGEANHFDPILPMTPTKFSAET